GSGNLDVVPEFVGPGDYHLTAGSPLIDAGSFATGARYLDGYPRPVDGNGDSVVASDIGAYEFTDSDGDDTDDRVDNCPTTSNPTQQDADGDRHGDVCDN